MIRSIAAALVLAAGVGSLAAGPALGQTPAPEDGSRVILVLDASGSMWGQIEGRSKIEIARETVAKVLTTWRPQDELGLVVYGHRTKGDCSDIETVIAPGPLDRERFISTVNGFNPVGKTPMSDAVRQAANDLRSSEQAATVILISDGEETCGRDPCAVARELEEAGVGLTVHTIGFDVAEDSTRDQLACMAQETGGQFLTAANAAELEVALAQTVAASQMPPPPAPTAQPSARLADNLKAVARLVEGGPEIDVSARWQILAVAADGSPGEVISTHYPVALSERVPPGAYIVRVTLEDASAEQAVTVPETGTLTLDLILNAGHVAVSVVTHDGGPAAEGARVQLRQGGTIVHTGYGSQVRRLVPEGTYTVTGLLEDVEVAQEISVTAGAEAPVNLVLGSGRLAFTVRREAGGPIERSPTVQIRTPGGQVVHTAYSGEDGRTLPPGSYVLRAKIGEAIAEQTFEIKAGETTTVDLVVAAGRLAVTVVFAPGGPEVKDARIDILPEARPIDGRDEVLETAYGSGEGFDLAPGRYRVRARKDVATAEIAVEVTGSTLTGSEVVLNAGVLAFSVPADARVDVLAAEPDIYGKQEVLETRYSGDQTLVMPAGRYVVRGSAKGETLFEIPVEITAGKRTEAKP